MWPEDTADPAVPVSRVRWLQITVLLAAAALIARLWWVQIACGDLYEQISQGMRTRHVVLPAPRGVIYDRQGRILATTEPQYLVAVDPAELRRHTAAERADIFTRAARILNISVPDMQDILDRSRQASFSSIKLKSNVGPAVITRLLEDSSELPGVDVEQAPVRVYPMGAVASHVLGYLGDVTAADLKRTDGEGYTGVAQIGEQGLERSYESTLRGRDGERVIEVNAKGVPVSNSDLSRTEPTPGDALVLTLDANLQRAAQTAFPDNMRGSVVAIDVHTGGILALASKPGFDPNVFVQDTPEARKQKVAYLTDTSGPLQDRAIMSRYPPGSTFKLVSSAAGFANNVIDLKNYVYCAGGMRLGGKRGQWKKCWQYHGSVDYMDAMARSCDTYFYDLMRRLSATELAATARSFGLGERTGIDLPSEKRGFVPTPAWKLHRFKKDRWYFGDSCNLAIGQGFLQVTSLQMAEVTAAVANGGQLVQPHLVATVKSPTGQVVQRFQPHVSTVPGVSPQALALVRQGMRAAVVPGGTAGIVRFKDLDVAAKTGSAQDRADQPTHAWFVCFAPYENPQIAICSMVEHGGHGGVAAGPIARAILRAYFHLKDTGDTASAHTD